ncbi:MAG: hypothetical protein PUA62_10015 [Lachnospiraceae bacterium]|nr:hypothetical protein [Lachnospiraceae bacterium]
MDNNQNQNYNNYMGNGNLPFNGDASSFHANIPNTEQYAQQIQQNMMMQGQMQYGPSTQQYGQPQQYGSTTQTKEKRSHKKLVIALLSIFLVLAAGGLTTYLLMFTPEKRFERALDKANAAFEDADYSLAMEQYEKALSLEEDNIDAMYGMLQVDFALGNQGTLADNYVTFTSRISNMDAKEFAGHEEEISDIFLYCTEVYADDNDAICSELELAMTLVDDARLLDTWVTIRMAEADALREISLEEAAASYDLILDYQPDYADALAGRTECVRGAIEYYISIGGYEQADALISTYRDKITDINFVDLETRVADIRMTAEAGAKLMAKVYDAMAAGDYARMCEIDGSAEAEDFADMISTDCYLYAPDGFTDGYTGKAAGLYKGSYIYYFYYGDYVDGVRSGSGVTFMLKDSDFDTYEMYDGKWSNDMPNGNGVSGTYHEWNADEYISTYEVGQYVDGYANGTFTTTIESESGYTVYGEWTADMGVVDDVRDQYPEYEFNIAEGRTLYSVLMSDESDTVWYLSIPEGSVIRASNWFD